MYFLFLGSLVQTDARKMYLLETNIMTFDFKSHIALMMVITLLYFKDFFISCLYCCCTSVVLFL